MKKRLALLLCLMLALTALAPTALAEETETPQPSIYDFAVTLKTGLFNKAKTYTLPCSYADFVKDGWKPATGMADPAETDVKNEHGVEIEMVNGKSKLNVLVTNMTGATIKASKGEVGGFGVASENVTFEIGGVGNDTTLDELIAAYGVPLSASWEADENGNRSFTYFDSDESGMDFELLSLYQPGDVIPSKAKYLSFTADAAGKITGFAINSWVPFEPFAPTYAGKKVAGDYQAPTALDDALGSPIVEIDGDLYEFPAPLSAFVENGWTRMMFRSNFSILSSNAMVLMYRGPYLLRAFVLNATGVEDIDEDDASVTGVSAESNSNLFPVVKLSGGVDGSMDEATFLSAMANVDGWEKTEPNEIPQLTETTEEPETYFSYQYDENKRFHTDLSICFGLMEKFYGVGPEGGMQIEFYISQI